MSIWDEGLNNEELQKLHKLLKLNMNIFLTDILSYTNMFSVTDKGGFYEIYPLFYCDEIRTDGDAIINGTYKIICKKNYQQIFLFISDNPFIIKNYDYILQKVNDNYVIFIYDEKTLQPARNSIFTIKYANDGDEQYTTDTLGYCIFEAKNDDFEVLV